jgi:hypothetical protein
MERSSRDSEVAGQELVIDSSSVLDWTAKILMRFRSDGSAVYAFRA